MTRYAETINEHPFPPTFKVGALEKIAARCTRSDLPPTLAAGDGGGQYDMERVFANMFRHLYVSDHPNLERISGLVVGGTPRSPRGHRGPPAGAEARALAGRPPLERPSLLRQCQGGVTTNLLLDVGVPGSRIEGGFGAFLGVLGGVWMVLGGNFLRGSGVSLRKWRPP